MKPWISIYTPTYKRPRQLEACMRSVERQSAVRDIEHVIAPDYVGLGVGGTFVRLRDHAAAGFMRGDYVYFLADDDVLASTGAVAHLKALVDDAISLTGNPPDVVIVGSQKPGGYYPPTNQGPPVEGSIDLGCLVVRRVVWQGLAAAGAYGNRYEGDADFAKALWATPGLHWVWHRELHFCTGAASHGKFEGQWP